VLTTDEAAVALAEIPAELANATVVKT